MLYCLDDPSTNFAEMTLAARFAPEGGGCSPRAGCNIFTQFFQAMYLQKNKGKIGAGLFVSSSSSCVLRQAQDLLSLRNK